VSGRPLGIDDGEAKLMHQALCTAGAVLLVLLVAAASTGDQPNPGDKAVLVDVSGPTVVGFVWSGHPSSIDESDKETIAFLQSALEDVTKCLKNENKPVRIEFAHVFRLRSDGSEETIEIPLNYPRSVGAILARPGVHSRIVYSERVLSPHSPVILQTASEYFDAPACRPER
jgi:hypothetical protein